MAVSTTISALALWPVAWWLSQTGRAAVLAGQCARLVGGRRTGAAIAGRGPGTDRLALSRLSVTLSSTGLLIQPVVAAAAAWLIFGEALRPASSLGALVLMLGIYLARRSQA